MHAPLKAATTSILPLRLEAAGFEIGGRALLEDIQLEFRPGAPTLILGPNGAGKSLLLRLCHGLLQPSRGRIFWGHAARCEGPVRDAQAMVFQKPVLLRRSALANVIFPLKRRAISSAERRARAAEALEKVGLMPLAERPARVLSGGEQQRLALARAWALRPEMLFLDEPTAHLDPGSTRQVEAIVGEIARQGTKIVMTTHDLGQARRLAGDIIFLHQGRVLEHAPAADFFSNARSDAARAFLNGDLPW